MGLIFDENYREIDAFYDFVLNEVGADKLKLNFIQPSFGHNAPEDEFFANHHRVDPDVLYELIGECDRKYNLGLNPLWREQVRMNVGKTSAIAVIRPCVTECDAHPLPTTSVSTCSTCLFSAGTLRT